MAGLLHAAKRYVIEECRVDYESETSTAVSSEAQGTNPSALKKFTFLATKLRALTRGLLTKHQRLALATALKQCRDS